MIFFIRVNGGWKVLFVCLWGHLVLELKLEAKENGGVA